MGDSVVLTSPIFGSKLTVTSPNRFGTSRFAFKDLKHVEAQIQEGIGLPDFGYAGDNYLIEDGAVETRDKWNTLI